MDFVYQNLITILAILGISLLAIEMLIMGFSTFILTYFGVALVISALAMYVGIIPETVGSAVLSTAVLATVAWAVLWKPLKRMQNQVDTKPVTSDMVGYSFLLESDVGPNLHGQHHYSGIDWKVVSDSPITAQTRVKVVELNVGEMRVEAA